MASMNRRMVTREGDFFTSLSVLPHVILLPVASRAMLPRPSSPSGELGSRVAGHHCSAVTSRVSSLPSQMSRFTAWRRQACSRRCIVDSCWSVYRSG